MSAYRELIKAMQPYELRKPLHLNPVLDPGNLPKKWQMTYVTEWMVPDAVYVKIGFYHDLMTEIGRFSGLEGFGRRPILTISGVKIYPVDGDDHDKIRVVFKPQE